MYRVDRVVGDLAPDAVNALKEREHIEWDRKPPELVAMHDWAWWEEPEVCAQITYGILRPHRLFCLYSVGHLGMRLDIKIRAGQAAICQRPHTQVGQNSDVDNISGPYLSFM